MRVLLYTNARNERNIAEWCAHHLLLGFNGIFIFDHKSDQPIIDYLRPFSPKVKILRVDGDGNIKIKLMKSAVNHAISLNADWMIYLDADEFLVLNSFSNVKEMLQLFDQKGADHLCINWLMFGSNNLINQHEGLIIDSYTKSELKLNQHVKSFVKPSKVVNIINPHFYIINNDYRRFDVCSGGIHHNTSNFAFNNIPLPFIKSPAYIAHYVFQSEESYKKRKQLLPADDGSGFRSIPDNFHNLYNDIENRQLIVKYSQNIKDFLQRFGKTY
uniref:Glycosyltransferase 2-like domain-containing protein n=1 Tax=viral metagenome TaxID=1070528 RepID=A0A6C0H6G5_9ZZZZ